MVLLRRSRHAIRTVSGIGDTSVDFVGRWICIFPCGGIFDSHPADFCGDLVGGAFVYGWDANGVRLSA